MHLAKIIAAQSTQSDKKAITVLEKLFSKLSSYETINYNYYRGLNYFSENYHRETEGNVFLDFRGKDTALGFKYQVDNKDLKSVL